jgi:adenine/guanine phosphoribosyltransferase-like PRPP-binding protein
LISCYSYHAEIADRKGVAGAQETAGTEPPATYHKPYDYEMHTEDVTAGQNVLVVDDLLAKGGTARACCGLAEMAGAQVVACAFLMELVGLGGAALLAPRNVFSLLRY